MVFVDIHFTYFIMHFDSLFIKFDFHENQIRVIFNYKL